MKRKSEPIDDDRLKPEQERGLAYGIAQGEAGLSYGPFGKKGLSMQKFMKLTKRTRSVSIKIPAVLFNYLQKDAKRFDLTVEELMAAILETHQFKDQDRQLILMAIEAASPSTSRARTRRSGKK